MHRIILAAVVAAAVALALSGATLAGGQDPAPAPASTPAPTASPYGAWSAEAVPPATTLKEYKRAVKRVYRYSTADGNFVARQGIGDRQHSRLRRLRRWARTSQDRRKMLRFQDRWKKGWRRVRSVDRMTPYGKWAIEPYIVMCESGGSWSAANPSGAVGPYQLLGKGAPMPADTVSEWATHHIIAAGLWAGGSGRSHWQQCL